MKPKSEPINDIIAGQLFTTLSIARHLENRAVIPAGSCAAMLEERLNHLPPKFARSQAREILELAIHWLKEDAQSSGVRHFGGLLH